MIAAGTARLDAAQGTRYELANDRIVLAVDAAGRLTELTNRQTGHRYLTTPGRPLWRMYYRTAHAKELEIPAGSQNAEVRREGNTLIVAYRTLKGDVPLPGASRELQASLTLRVSLEGDRLVWTAVIDNREKQPGPSRLARSGCPGFTASATWDWGAPPTDSTGPRTEGAALLTPTPGCSPVLPARAPGGLLPSPPTG